LKSNATALGAAAAALGGVLYVVLTWVSSWVYQPAGVRPSDVGLGYVPLLAGTAVALVSALAVVLAVVAVGLGAVWLLKKALGKALLKKQAWALGVALIALLVPPLVATFLWISRHGISGNAALFLSFLSVAVAIAIISGERAYKVIAISATILALAVAGVTEGYSDRPVEVQADDC
jgi:hypothetical protein